MTILSADPFTEWAMVMLLGALGFIALYHAFCGGLPDRLERQTWLRFLLPLTGWGVGTITAFAPTVRDGLTWAGAVLVAVVLGAAIRRYTKARNARRGQR